MRNRIILNLVLFIVINQIFNFTALAQDTNPTTPAYQGLNLGSEIQNKINFPKSPEAAAFEKYGDTPVDLFSGATNIEVPLHAVKGRELEIPISITNDATGIKVNQNSTTVGLGWNLKVGGRITRIVNGLPDDNLTTSPYNNLDDFQIIYNQVQNIYESELLLREYNELLINLKNGCKDLLFDIYNLNVMGINDYIYIDEYEIPRTLINPNINVTKNGNSWIITDEIGNKYYFDNVFETTTTSGISDEGSIPCASSSITSVSSWVLTKITSKNGFDVFDFSYNSFYWSNTTPFVLSQTCRNAKNNNGFWSINGITNNYDGEFSNTQKCISQIKLNNSVMCDFFYKSRSDINFINSLGNALDNIKIYKFNHDNQPNSYLNPVLKTVTFNHSYFGSDQNPTLNQRLKLNNFTIRGENDLINYKTYRFEYNEQFQLPPKNSYAQDILGLYNGITSNSSLIGKLKVGLDLLDGADREFRLNYAIMGSLKKIYYPSKGYTEFVYEQHDSDTPPLQNQQIQNISISSNFIEYNNRSEFIHSGMTDAFVTGVNSMLMDISTSGIYNIDCGGDAIWLIHKPLCLDNLDQPAISTNNVATNTFNPTNPLSIAPRCVNVELRPTVEIFTIPGQANNGISGYTGSCPQTLQLPAGQYQVTVWGKENPNGPGPGGNGSGLVATTTTPHLRIYKNVLITPFSDLTPGFRIQTIKNFNHDAILQSTKKYVYKTQINGLISSGKKLESLETKHNSYEVTTIIPTLSENNCPQGTYEKLNIIRSSTTVENSPHIQYSNVFEISENEGLYNGYTNHIFSNDSQPSGLISNNGVKSYKRKSLIGKEIITQHYNQDHFKISETQNLFNLRGNSDNYNYLYGGVASVTDYEFIDHMMMWYKCQYWQGDALSYANFKLELLGFHGQPNGPGTPILCPILQIPFEIHASNPTYCSGQGSIQQFGITTKVGEYSNYLAYSQFDIDDRAILSKKINTSFINAQNSITNEERFFYNNCGFISTKTTVKSSGNYPDLNIIDGIKTQYLYNDNFDCNPEKISKEISFRIQNSTENKLFEKEYLYGDYGFKNGMFWSIVLTK